ncbi:MAG: hypothetical protein WAL59_12645 [Roseiarcus sp.]
MCAAGASLGTVRKWERGERSPSGAARMLAPILARDPALVIAEAGLAEGTRGEGGVTRIPRLLSERLCLGSESANRE